MRTLRRATLKILGSHAEGDLPQQDMNDVITVLHAQQQFLEDKYSSLIVKARHSKDVASMFEMLNAGTSGLSDRHRENLTLAVQTQPGPQRPERDNNTSYRQRGRSGFRGYSRRPDQVYNQATNRNFPSNRPPPDENRD